MASPFHVAIAAAAPDRSDFPAGIGVRVPIRATRWWHDHPAADGGHEIADKVIGELVAWFGHGDVVPRRSDRNFGDGNAATLAVADRRRDPPRCGGFGGRHHRAANP